MSIKNDIEVMKKRTLETDPVYNLHMQNGFDNCLDALLVFTELVASYSAFAKYEHYHSCEIYATIPSDDYNLIKECALVACKVKNPGMSSAFLDDIATYDFKTLNRAYLVSFRLMQDELRIDNDMPPGWLGSQID